MYSIPYHAPNNMHTLAKNKCYLRSQARFFINVVRTVIELAARSDDYMILITHIFLSILKEKSNIKCFFEPIKKRELIGCHLNSLLKNLQYGSSWEIHPKFSRTLSQILSIIPERVAYEDFWFTGSIGNIRGHVPQGKDTIYFQ